MLFQEELAVKIWMDSFKGVQSYRGFKLRGWAFLKFLAPLVVKLFT